MVSRAQIHRSDENQAEIVSALRQAGASVELLSQVGKGCPDIIVGWRGVNLLMEIKGEKGKLNELQESWFEGWNGQAVVVRTVDEALSWLEGVRV